MKKLITDIENEIKKAAGIDEPVPEEKFHKDREYLSYGLKARDFHIIMKEFKSRVLEYSLEQRLQIAEDLFSRQIGELGLAGIYITALSIKEIGPEHFDILNRMVDTFRSWSQVDYFCGEVVQPLLKNHTSKVLSLLREWNSSTNRWKRRASVVTFTRKVAKEGKFVQQTLNYCDNLIWDKEDIVRKGVGWALKDTMRSAPQQIKDYVKKLRKLGVSSTITLYAIRDLKDEEREEILQVRKGG